MAPKGEFSTGIAETLSENRQGGQIRVRSLPEPQEGLRLMHAFLEIRRADVREAIVKYVEEQSRRYKDA
jgi:hypothetical protein